MQGLTFATWMLMAASFGMTAIASVRSYQALFVMPEYLASPPGSLRRYQAARGGSGSHFTRSRSYRPPASSDPVFSFVTDGMDRALAMAQQAAAWITGEVLESPAAA